MRTPHDALNKRALHLSRGGEGEELLLDSLDRPDTLDAATGLQSAVSPPPREEHAHAAGTDGSEQGRGVRSCIDPNLTWHRAGVGPRASASLVPSAPPDRAVIGARRSIATARSGVAVCCLALK
jgi:hypothetical protein